MLVYVGVMDCWVLLDGMVMLDVMWLLVWVEVVVCLLWVVVDFL